MYNAPLLTQVCNVKQGEGRYAGVVLEEVFVK